MTLFVIQRQKRHQQIGTQLSFKVHYEKDTLFYEVDFIF